MMKFFIAIIIILVPITAVQAGSTALEPAKFMISGQSAGLVSEPVLVKNLSTVAQHYRFYPEEGSGFGEKNISVVPSQFVLGPGQSLQAVVRVKAGSESWRANLNLVAYTASQMRSNFRVGDGIKIPVFFNAPQVLGASFKTTGLNAYWWAMTALAFSLALALAGVVFYIYYRRTFWRQIRARHRISFL